MSTLNQESWRVISAYLDQALDLPRDERGALLERLRTTNEPLVPVLERLLREYDEVERERFLELRPEGFPAHALMAGAVVGAYTLVSPIGEGGMGTVWLAERCDGRFERRVAVKFLSAAVIGRGGEERFKREGSILGRLAHPHIAELMDAGVWREAQPYLVLEYVDGEHIDRYCDERHLDSDARVRLFLDVLGAVSQAHANLIVHRDIKPSNVLVRRDGAVKLLDFGIAKLMGEEGENAGKTAAVTAQAGAGITPQYAAPEQLTGAPVTTATDVYALGVLLYVLLTGQHPAGHGTHSTADLVKAIVDTEPRRPSEVAPSNRALRGDLDTIILKALKKRPEQRYASVSALGDDLRRYLDHEPISARPDTWKYRAGKFVRRNRTAVALSSVAILVAVGGVAGIVAESLEARAQRSFAMQQLARAEAINDLNSFVLSDAAPSGKPFTVSELLGRAERIVQRQHGQAGSSRVELLTSIGVQYWAQDQDDSAARVLEEAYRLSLKIPEPATRARASCALAIALARGREPARAEALIKEGLRQLSDQSQFILDRVFCLERGSEVALTQGAAQQAIERAHQARELLTKSPFQSDVLQLDALMQEAEAYRVAGQFEKSSNAYEQASGLLTGLGRDETQAAIVVLNNWGLAKQFLGRTLDAENLFRRAIAISTTNSAEESVSPMLLVNYSRVLRELGRLVEAAGYAERAYDKAQRAGDQMVLNQSLFVRASIYRQAGDLARSAEMVSELEPRLRRSLPAGHLAFASLGMEQAAIAQSRGDLESAFAQVSRAVAMADASIQAGGGDGADYIPTLLLRRSTLELDMGRTDEAASDAARALQLVRRNASPGAFSSRVGLALLAVARARKAQGNRDEARAASHSAIEHLETTLGAAHPDVRAARQLAADLDSGRP